MGLALADFASPVETTTSTPLALVSDDATVKVSDALTLGVCKRGHGEPVLARFKPGKPAKAATENGPGEPEVLDCWRATSRISDIARAIAGGLLQ